jgi:enamine deaminase RidA (YjgF/YER057c/UK114 family)
VIFLATRFAVENWENPEQTPAYCYPAQYGPRAPAFARASRFTDNNGVEWIFISGTAAIKGHETLHCGNFGGQLQVTLENVDIVLKKCGMRLEDCVSGRRRHFKAFLRHRSDLPELLNRMKTVMTPRDSLTVVEGDICREDLVVEIELTVFPVSEGTD